MVSRVLVTGATGFVGRSLYKKLSELEGIEVTAAVRSELSEVSGNKVVLGCLSDNFDLSEALKKQDVVVHTAALAHNKTKADRAEIERVNTFATLRLAEQAAANGVKRFVFLSSIGVNGLVSEKPFSETDIPKPHSEYAESKYLAEKELFKLQEETGLDVVVIRPPLVYGRNAPGNFAKLVGWINKGIPLPLGSVKNKRSYIAIDNLVDFITTCIEHPRAKNQIFLVADGEDMSTTEFLRRTARSMGKRPNLIPVSAKLLRIGAQILGKREMANRLLGSLQINTSKAERVLGWLPIVSVDEGLHSCFRKDRP
jgi:nucleoside-diphosphate-sugar epimerase